MRSEEGIRALIKRQEVLLALDGTPDQFKQIIGHGIRAIRWCLGEKIPRTYYCTTCAIEHECLECPSCHNMSLYPVQI